MSTTRPFPPTGYQTTSRRAASPNKGSRIGLRPIDNGINGATFKKTRRNSNYEKYGPYTTVRTAGLESIHRWNGSTNPEVGKLLNERGLNGTRTVTYAPKSIVNSYASGTVNTSAPSMWNRFKATIGLKGGKRTRRRHTRRRR